MWGLLLLVTTLGSCLAADDCLFTAVDLTQEFSPSTNYYPDFYPFEVSLENAISETFANASKYVAGDEGGTKVEVPARFKEDGFTIGQLFKDRLLFLQACVIDLAEKSAMNDNYQASVQDVEEWQYIFGGFPQRAIVVFDFGWSPKYSDADRYFGRRDTLNHPGLSPELADYLGRHDAVVAVGTDSPDVDCGRNNELSTSPSQRVLAAHNKYTVTQLALSRHRLPAVGAVLTIAPFFMADATAAPARVFAEFCADPEPGVKDPEPVPPPPVQPQIQYVYVSVPTPAATPASTPAATQGQAITPLSYASASPSTTLNNNKPYIGSPSSSGNQGYATQSFSPTQTYQYVASQGSNQGISPSTPTPSSLTPAQYLQLAALAQGQTTPATSPSLTAAQYLQLAALAQEQATPNSPSATSPYLQQYLQQLAVLAQEQANPFASPSSSSPYLQQYLQQLAAEQAMPIGSPSPASAFLNLLSPPSSPAPGAPSLPRHLKPPPSLPREFAPSFPRSPQPHSRTSSPNPVNHEHPPAKLGSGPNRHSRAKQSNHLR